MKGLLNLGDMGKKAEMARIILTKGGNKLMEDVSLFCMVNKQDGSRDAALEAKHTPVIKIDGPQKVGAAFKVTIDVGEGKHPNLHEHFIQWVDLYAGAIFLGRADLSAVTTSPEVSFNITLHHEGDRTLRSFAKCNMHGVWEGATTVQIGGR